MASRVRVPCAAGKGIVRKSRVVRMTVQNPHRLLLPGRERRRRRPEAACEEWCERSGIRDR